MLWFNVCHIKQKIEKNGKHLIKIKICVILLLENEKEKFHFNFCISKFV